MNVTLRYGAGTYQHQVYGAATTAGGETVIVLDRPWLPVDLGPLLVIGTPAYGWAEVWRGPRLQPWLATAAVGDIETFGRRKLTKIDPAGLPRSIALGQDCRGW